MAPHGCRSDWLLLSMLAVRGVHLLDGFVHGNSAGRKRVVEHLREDLLLLALHHLDRQAEVVLRALAGGAELLEIAGVRPAIFE